MKEMTKSILKAGSLPFPHPHLTPYTEIRSVAPACFSRFTPEKHVVQRYWEFDGAKRIRYRIDGEYEEHFRALLEQSVRRRLEYSC